MARAINRAEQHAIDGDELIARQRELIANLWRSDSTQPPTKT